MVCKVRGWDDACHCHHKRRRHRLGMEPSLKYGEMVHVEDERLLAIFTSEFVGACDKRTNSLHTHIQVGQAAATHDVVGLGDRLADPGRCALECEGAILELLVKLPALVAPSSLIIGEMRRRGAVATSMCMTLTRLRRNSS